MSRSPVAPRKVRAVLSPAEPTDLDDDIEFDGFDDFDDGDEDLYAHDLSELSEVDGDPRFPELETSDREAMRSELEMRLGAYLRKGRPRVIITDNLRTMLSVKRGQGVYTFRLHHMFVDAPSRVLRAVATYAERQDRDAAEALRAFIDANEDAIRKRSRPRTFAIDVAGRFHNLQAIFDELNAEYFGGAIQARITWGPRTKRKKGRQSIKLGSYTVEDQLIRVHPVLDAEDVPHYYIAWVIYHEMLHEIHDMPIVDGRRVYHTRAFRQAEAKYEHYPKAVLWERTNLHKLLDR